ACRGPLAALGWARDGPSAMAACAMPPRLRDRSPCARGDGFPGRLRANRQPERQVLTKISRPYLRTCIVSPTEFTLLVTFQRESPIRRHRGFVVGVRHYSTHGGVVNRAVPKPS